MTDARERWLKLSRVRRFSCVNFFSFLLYIYIFCVCRSFSSSSLLPRVRSMNSILTLVFEFNILMIYIHNKCTLNFTF